MAACLPVNCLLEPRSVSAVAVVAHRPCRETLGGEGQTELALHVLKRSLHCMYSNGSLHVLKCSLHCMYSNGACTLQGGPVNPPRVAPISSKRPEVCWALEGLCNLLGLCCADCGGEGRVIHVAAGGFDVRGTLHGAHAAQQVAGVTLVHLQVDASAQL